jgi:hypothetical protein
MTLQALALVLGLAGLLDTNLAVSAQVASSSVSYKDVSVKGMYLGDAEGVVRAKLGPPSKETAGAGELGCEDGGW